MFCPKCGDLLMGMPVDGVMQCTKPECKDAKAEVDERFNSTTEALPERITPSSSASSDQRPTLTCAHTAALVKRRRNFAKWTRPTNRRSSSWTAWSAAKAGGRLDVDRLRRP